MGRTYDAIDERLRSFLLSQPVFFVGTAPLDGDGHVNVSPKGLAGTFAVLDDRHVAYLDLTGSGVETIAHLRENGRIVLMFCAFEGPPRIVRLHGRGSVHTAGSEAFARLAPRFQPRAGMRSIVEVAVARIADSCGFGVPVLRYEGQRRQLEEWAERKGDEGIARYWAEKNAASIDGLPGLPSGAAG